MHNKYVKRTLLVSRLLQKRYDLINVSIRCIQIESSMGKGNKERKFPAEIVVPLLMLAGWILYSGKTIGRHGGASRIDDPYTYWAILGAIVGFILYKIVEHFDL